MHARSLCGLLGFFAATAPLAAIAAPDADAVASSTGTAGPEADVAVTAAPRETPPPRMGWFGAGIRVGMQDVHLLPPGSLVSAQNAATGQSFASGDFAVDTNAWTVTPTLHLGGSGFFFKLDVPLSFAPQLTTFGLGLYPINFGLFIRDASLFPYLSAGAAANLVDSRNTGDPSTSNKLVGAFVQARGAIGLKYFPMQGLAVSGELGYSPWAAGILLITPPGSSTQVHGGTGSVFDFSLGLEWL